jgi:hypothetical protein
MYVSNTDWIVLIVILVFFCWVSCLGGKQSKKDEILEQAVQHKAGEYVIINEEKGYTEFKWNDEIEILEGN